MAEFWIEICTYFLQWNNKDLLVSRFIIAKLHLHFRYSLCFSVQSFLFLLNGCYMWEILMCEVGWWYSLTSSAHFCFLTLRFMSCNLTVLKFYTILKKLGQLCEALFLTMIFLSAAWLEELWFLQLFATLPHHSTLSLHLGFWQWNFTQLWRNCHSFVRFSCNHDLIVLIYFNFWDLIARQIEFCTCFSAVWKFTQF
jgi:hypothetical protein